MAEPVTPFWEGYKRDPKMTEQVVEALRVALYTFPSLRLGQLLVNVADMVSAREYLFNLHDEDLITGLEEFMARHAT